jgi:predicted dienelactone hydrolase
MHSTRGDIGRIAPMVGCAILLVAASCGFQPQRLLDPGQPGSYAVASVGATTTNPATGSELSIDIYYPANNGGVDASGAPYPALVFAPGFLANATSYSGNGEHLASWGNIVAIPDFPSQDAEVRASDVQYLFSYLMGENTRGDSLFFNQIEPSRLGLTGHSLGGLNTLMIAARNDPFLMAGVALDPAGGPFSSWDYEAELPHATAPLLVIGSEMESELCNSSAIYNDMFPYIGATHRVKIVIAGGSHCDFMDSDETEITLCYWICGGDSEGREQRLELAEGYSAAWFNYYVQLDTDYYAYLYGDVAEQDIQAGRITREVQTAPRDVVATGQAGAVELEWTLYDHPIIAGYNIYRSQGTGDASFALYAQVGRVSSFLDTDVVRGREYHYVLRSRDAAGNEHEPSAEVSATALGYAHSLYLPLGLKP